MNKEERQKILTNNLKMIYDEYSAYTYHLLALKPFFKDLIDISNGKNPKFDLADFTTTNNLQINK